MAGYTDQKAGLMARLYRCPCQLYALMMIVAYVGLKYIPLLAETYFPALHGFALFLSGAAPFIAMLFLALMVLSLLQNIGNRASQNEYDFRVHM